jgi:16S rRNA (guanine(1405)-N(7))-methyltransferase
MKLTDAEIDAIVNQVKASKKYKYLCADTIRDVVKIGSKTHTSLKNLLKFARKKCHLILASYLSELDYSSAGEELKSAFLSRDRDRITNTCLNIMAKHASTRERITILSEFYSRLFKITGPPKRMVDLACALNPFSFRWMGLSKDIFYYAYDNNIQTVKLLKLYFQLEGLQPLVEERDILCRPMETAVDVGLLFKMYHCLEHRQKGAGWRVIEKTPAQWMAVSFPTRNLANRNVDIFSNYKQDMLEKIKKNRWNFDIVEFENEMVLLINKEEKKMTHPDRFAATPLKRGFFGLNVAQ